MRRLLALYRKELLTYFVSPVAYIILFVFLGVNGITFYYYLVLARGNVELLLLSQYGLIPFWFLVLLVPPLLTMRTFAEERRTGTFELLVTSGVGDVPLVLAKFLGAWTFYAFLWATVLPLIVLLHWVGRVDWGIVVAIHAGILLLGALLTSVGVLASTLTRNQLVAAAVSMIANLTLLFANSFRAFFEVGQFELQYFNYVSPLFHFTRDFSRGVFDLRYLVLYASVTVFFLFLATKSLERRRWW
ncbi:MAG: ABC transporter permease [Planctomycetota bacterium]